MPQRQDTHRVLLNYESIEREVSRVAERDDQLAQVSFDAPSHEWVRGEVRNR